MKSIGAFVVAVGVAGAVVAWAGGAGADESAGGDPPGPGRPRKVAYIDPSSPTSAPSPYGDAAQTPVQTYRRMEDDNNSALDTFRLGAFGGVGFPRPLSIEAFAKIEKAIGLGVEYSVMPTLSLGGVDTTFWAITGDVRIFPFENGFFIGMTAGRQHVGASTTLSISSETLPESVTADTWLINPRIGFLSTSSWGLTLGIDAGVQIPLSASIVSTIPQNLPVSVPLATDATNMAHLLGKSVLPTVDLLRIGLLL